MGGLPSSLARTPGRAYAPRRTVWQPCFTAQLYADLQALAEVIGPQCCKPTQQTTHAGVQRHRATGRLDRHLSGWSDLSFISTPSPLPEHQRFLPFIRGVVHRRDEKVGTRVTTEAVATPRLGRGTLLTTPIRLPAFPMRVSGL